MVQINFAQRQVNAKIVFYGPGMSGKTTNLEIVHQRAPAPNRGDLTSISTDGDRTLFFDFMPLDLGTVAGMRTCFQLYTVPGQVYYNSTRKLVLQGVDGIVFVADSSAAMVEENLESLRNLEQNLAEYGKSLSQIPLILQYNKRDLPDALPVEELNRLLNPYGAPWFEAIANTGQGVFPTLKALAARVLESIHTGSKGSQGQSPTVTSGQTGYYQQPNVQNAPAPLPQQPRGPLQQTGYYNAASAQQAPRAAAPGQPMPAMQAPMQPVSMGPGYADPLARTNIHAPPALGGLPPVPQPPGPVHGQPQGAIPMPQAPMHAQSMPPQGHGGMHPQGGMQAQSGYAQPMQPGAPMPMGGPSMSAQQQGAYGYGAPLQQGGMRPNGPAEMAPQPQMSSSPTATLAPSHPQPSPLQMMRNDRGAVAPQQAPQNRARPAASSAPSAAPQAPPSGRIAPRSAPLPTPSTGKRRLVYVGIFLGIALLVGAALARGILTIF